MQTRLAISSSTKLHRLLLAQSQKYKSFSSSTGGRTADPAIHSGPLEGDDLEESVKFSENEKKQPNIKSGKAKDAFVPPKSPIGSSQKIESTGVNQPIDPLTQQKRQISSNATEKTSLENASCAGLDGSPWPDESKSRGDQFEDDKEYFSHHKPSPLAEMEMADTRKPITQATDAPPDDGIPLYPAPWGGMMVWRPEQLDTAEEALLRAMEIWKMNAMRGDPDSPQDKKMEGVSTRVYRGLKGYWRRRGYQKLNRNNRVDLSTEGSTRKRKFWKIKLTPKLKLKINFKRFSLKKLLIGLRDAYVNAMLRVANTRGFGGEYGGGIDGFGMRRVKEYDEKMLVEIYKSMIIAQGKLGTRAAAKIGPEINVNGN